jgi:hypothetical protein
MNVEKLFIEGFSILTVGRLRPAGFEELAYGPERVAAPLEVLDLAEPLEVRAVIQGDTTGVTRWRQQPLGLIRAHEGNAHACGFG